MAAPPSSLRSEWAFLALVAAGGITLRLIWLVIIQGDIAAFPSAGKRNASHSPSHRGAGSPMPISTARA